MSQTPQRFVWFRGRIGTILLAFWLICTGLIVLLHLQMESLPIIMALLALGAGICLIMGW